MKKIIALAASVALAACCALGAAGCSGTSANTNDAANTTAASTPSGETQTLGNVTVFVPEGYTLQPGTEGAESDDEAWIYPATSGDAIDYYWITRNAENAEASIDVTKSLNEGAEDVTFTVGSTEWKGAAYEADGAPTAIVAATVNGTNYLVLLSNHELDAPETQAILGSLS